MRRTWILSTLAATGVALALAVIVWQSTGQNPRPDIVEQPPAQPVQPAKAGKAEPALPIRQVVLFNSGVGYFQREGEVEGDARVDLAFPTTDINDLLKSLIVQDMDKGKVSSVNYDSHDPIDKILHSFALDLNGNPSFGQILNQVRGEKIEIFRKITGDKELDANSKLAGTIVGIETRTIADKMDMKILTVLSQDRLMNIPLDNVESIRFLNPVLESEFQRALRVLASSHDTQKKTVSLGFNGQGKRNVKVGYVVEHPIWKTSYRLRMEPNDKVFIQGWAVVENTSDDDWNDVRMVLVSGRPISYSMNMYEPLYIPRPMVEPELFASLRPPVYGGAMQNPYAQQGQAGGSGRIQFAPVFVQPQMQWAVPNSALNGAQPSIPMTSKPAPAPTSGWVPPPATVYEPSPYPLPDASPLADGPMQNGWNQLNNKLTYEQLQQRRQILGEQRAKAKQDGAAIAGLNFKEGIASVATADELGDYYKYTLDQKITLPRQKSAMLPILDQTIDGSKVSIYNEAVHAKFPLLGLRLKNSSGQPLSQGPITVYEDGVYAGDTRILDLQANEERFLSYAVDQAVEIKSAVKSSASPDMHLSIGGAVLTSNYKMRETRTYTIKNRAAKDRTVILEHPIRGIENPGSYTFAGYRHEPDPLKSDSAAPGTWKLVEPKKPLETTRDLYRFQVKVPAGKTVTFEVVEEQGRVNQYSLEGTPQSLEPAGVVIKAQTQLSPETLLAVKIDKGLLVPTLKCRVSKAYFVQNNSDIERTFTVDHIVSAGWVRADAKPETQKGPDVFRFTLKVPAGKTANKEIIEERTYQEKGRLVRELPEEKIRAYLASDVPGDDVKAALTKFLAMNGKIHQSAKRLNQQEQQLKQLGDDQARLRENLKIIPQSSEPYKGFLEKFVAQESEIATFQKQIRELRGTLQEQQREIDVAFGVPQGNFNLLPPEPPIPVNVPPQMPQQSPKSYPPQSP